MLKLDSTHDASGSVRAPLRQQRRFPDETSNGRFSNVRAINARVASFGDSSSLPQLHWLQFVFPDQSVRTISESYIADISPSQSDYDVLVIVGNDVRRIRHLLRLYRPLLNAKPKIAVMQQSLPRDRATLLNAGFDEVLDPRMKVPEAQARALAIANRYFQVMEDTSASSELPLYRWLHSALPQMTPRERCVCEMLMKHYPNPVSVSQLATASPNRSAIAASSLRVMISSIRSKLPEGVLIEYHHPKAYAFDIVELRARIAR